MFFPALSTVSEKLYSTDTFGGLVTGEKSTGNTFSSMENLSGALFPKMSVREKRGIFTDEYGRNIFKLSSQLTAAVNTAEGIVMVTGDSVYLNGRKIEGVTLRSGVKNRSVVPIGRNVFIVPDGIYLKISDSSADVVSCNYQKTAENTFFNFSYSDGTDIFPSYYGSFPEYASAGDETVISSADSMELYAYSGAEWIKMSDVYIRLSLGGDVSAFSEGQSVYIESDSTDFLSGYYTVKKVMAESLVLEGSIPHEGEGVRVTVKSMIPEMDFAVEHNNRIWGCRFGLNNSGDFVNEIYASKLGDPTNWYSFRGISTDSYAANLGCSGEFTGAASLGNEVLFFKEDYIIRVLGHLPSEFQVAAMAARGVEKGAHKTVVNLNEKVFYKNSEGIMLYDGNFPVNISQAISSERFSAHCAGGIDGKYYISMTDSKNERGLYCFDTENGLWHREDDSFRSEFIIQKNGTLIFVCENGEGCRLFVTSAVKNESRQECFFSEIPLSVTPEEVVSWTAVTGMAKAASSPDKGKLRCVFITLSLGEDSFIEVSLQTDENALPEKIFFLDKPTKGIMRIPVNVPLCTESRLHFKGAGECVIHSVERRVRNSGEVKNFE